MRAKRRFKSFGLRKAQDKLLKEALTKLPALASVEPLLRTVPNRPAEAEDASVLPPLAELGATRRSAAWSRWAQAENPLDSNGFRACLELPPLVQAPGGDAEPGEEESPRPSRRPREWHLHLLPDCIDSGDGEALSVPAVARLVASGLGMDQPAADAIVDTACGGVPALLATCGTQTQALALAAALRDRGLSVRVTSRPIADSSPQQAFTSRVQDFAQLCYGTLRGDLFRLATRVQRGQAVGVNRCTDWRRTTDMNLKICPEDPIEAWFDREAGEEAKRLRARGTVVRKRFSKMVGGSLLLPGQTIEEQPGVSRATTQPAVSRASASQRDGLARASLALTRVNAGPGMQDMWNVAPVKTSVQKSDISPMWREACRMMRIFVFGKVVLDDAANEETSIEATLGSRESMATLHTVWSRLDSDHSGRVTIEEFNGFLRHHMRSFMEMNGAASLGGASDPEAFVKSLVDKVEKLLLNRKSSFCIEDVMRFLWPNAGRAQLKQMKQLMSQVAAEGQRVKTKPPPVLPCEELEGLRSLFKYLDKSCQGTLGFNDLVDAGVIHEDQVLEYQQAWDVDGTGRLDILEFFEMMCPAGYRAHAYSTSGSLPDGRRVLYDTVLQIWRMEDGADELDKGWL